MRSHCFAEATHSLMQTNSQLRRGGAHQASKQRIEERMSAQTQAATACADVVENPTGTTVIHRTVSRRCGDADSSN
jgi:hypothetical protein